MKGVNEYGGNEKVLVTICYEAAASLYQFGYSVLLIQQQWSFGSKLKSLHLTLKIFYIMIKFQKTKLDLDTLIFLV